MYFQYGKNKRSGVTANSTFDVILRGERTSTTRFDIWKGSERWKSVRHGDIIIRFFEDKFKKEHHVDVIVDNVFIQALRLFLNEQFEGWCL